MQIKGHVHYNASLDRFDLVFWVENAGEVVLSGLGLLNWQVYNISGTALTNPDASGSGVAANSTGVYDISEITSPTFIASGASYLVYASTEVNGNPLSTFIPFIITNI